MANGQGSLVEVRLARITIDDTLEEQVIVLKEREGERTLSMVIGPCEAIAIQRIVDERPFPRPLTHDLLGSVIGALGGVLTKIAVTDLRDECYYARLFIQRDGTGIEVDARPSDAVALALREGVPIFVSERVFKEAERK